MVAVISTCVTDLITPTENRTQYFLSPVTNSNYLICQLWDFQDSKYRSQK